MPSAYITTFPPWLETRTKREECTLLFEY